MKSHPLPRIGDPHPRTQRPGQSGQRIDRKIVVSLDKKRNVAQFETAPRRKSLQRIKDPFVPDAGGQFSERDAAGRMRDDRIPEVETLGQFRYGAVADRHQVDIRFGDSLRIVGAGATNRPGNRLPAFPVAGIDLHQFVTTGSDRFRQRLGHVSASYDNDSFHSVPAVNIFIPFVHPSVKHCPRCD